MSGSVPAVKIERLVVRTTDKHSSLSRRDVLKTGGATLVTASVVASGAIVGDAWAATPKALKPQTYATLVQMSRDIYPHDKFGDHLYAKTVDALDTAAEGDADTLKMLEDGVAGLDSAAKSAHGSGYASVAWERDRTALLRKIEGDAFFQKVRGDMVAGLYNQKEVWKLLGYEGESAIEGGYIKRGFDDIDWL